MKISSAKFLTSVADKNSLLLDDVPEVAFVGRSNVGKSSLINALLGQKNLAKTSSTPGLTKLVNYFLVNESFRIVDLPGYGFAKAGHKHVANWASLMEQYLLSSFSLRSVCVLLDCRHQPSDLDKMMIEFLNFHQIPYVLVATKVDKIAKSQIHIACEKISKSLAVRKELVFPFSSESLFGRERLLEYIGLVVQ